MLPTIGLVGLIIVVFYFMMFRPQKKERERVKQMLGNLRKNDEVITAGGIHGRVAAIKEDVIIIKIDENSDVKMRVSKSAVVGVVKREEEEEEEEEEQKEKKS
jgi:preprotein translocase subunit YajC